MTVRNAERETRTGLRLRIHHFALRTRREANEPS
jgi:hypothetical protein